MEASWGQVVFRRSREGGNSVPVEVVPIPAVVSCLPDLTTGDSLTSVSSALGTAACSEDTANISLLLMVLQGHCLVDFVGIFLPCVIMSYASVGTLGYGKVF